MRESKLALVLLDTCVWLSFLDKREREKRKDIIEGVFSHIEHHDILFPWPIAYETIRTRLVRNKDGMIKLDKIISSMNIEWIDDVEYRKSAWELSLDSHKNGRKFSMVDSFIRLYIEDTNNNIDSFVTFNGRDFNDVCSKRGVEILTEQSDWS